MDILAGLLQIGKGGKSDRLRWRTGAPAARLEERELRSLEARNPFSLKRQRSSSEAVFQRSIPQGRKADHFRLEPSLFLQPLQDFFYLRDRLGGRPLPLQDRFVSPGKITGADMAHPGLDHYLCPGTLKGGELGIHDIDRLQERVYGPLRLGRPYA